MCELDPRRNMSKRDLKQGVKCHMSVFKVPPATLEEISRGTRLKAVRNPEDLSK